MENWLEEMEDKHHIRILFAAETGSRAWGGAAEQSDYDIRFIFLHDDLKSYLSLDKALETIEEQSSIDVQGWDVFKAFTLLNKSNPSLMEWLYSPIICRDKEGFSRKLAIYVEESYSLYALFQHYIHLMGRNIKGLSDEEFTMKSQKKLIQATRAFLLAKTIITTEKLPKKALYSSFQSVFPAEDRLSALYREFICTKEQGRLSASSQVEECIHLMEVERAQMAAQCERLPRGKNVKEKLNQWIWELLHLG